MAEHLKQSFNNDLLPGVPFAFKTEPFAHQREQFERFKNLPFWALFADMGTGKTKSTIDLAAYHATTGTVQCLIVIAPNGVHRQWAEEQLPLHCPVPYVVCTWQNNHTKKWLASWSALMKAPTTLRVLCVNVEAFQYPKIQEFVGQLVRNFDTMVVVDEATRIKTPTALRTKAIITLGKHPRVHVRGALTGTPVAQGPLGLWSIFRFLGGSTVFPEAYAVFRAKYALLMERRVVVPGKGEVKGVALIDKYTWGLVRRDISKVRELTLDECKRIALRRAISVVDVPVIAQQTSYSPYTRVEELKARIAPYTLSVTKAECLDLPPKVYIEHVVELTPEQKRLLRDLKRTGATEHGAGVLTLQNATSLGVRIGQILSGIAAYDSAENGSRYATAMLENNPKLSALMDLLEDFPGQAIIWTVYTPELHAIMDALKKAHLSAVSYYGGTPSAEREEVRNKFVSGDAQFFVANPAAAGTGLNLQCALYQFWMSRSWSVEQRLQAEDRSHRSGVQGSVTYVDIVTDTLHERNVLRALREGRDLNAGFVGGATIDSLFDGL